MNLLENIKSEKPTLVNFYATWCTPCHMMKPNLEEATAKLGDSINFERIDVDQHRELSTVFQIRNVPTTMIFKNNDLIWRESGVVQPAVLVKMLEDLV